MASEAQLLGWPGQLLKVNRDLCAGHQSWDGPSAVVPSRVKGVIMLPGWEPIQLREGCRLPAPSRTHLATAEAQSSAGSVNPPGSPLNRGLADPSGCLGVLAQPCRDVVLGRCSPLLELPPDCHRTRAYTRARAESRRGHPALPRALTAQAPCQMLCLRVLIELATSQ